MDGAARRNRLIRFSVFQVDLDSGELFKQGRKVKLQGQPFELLLALLEGRGELVTREHLKQTIWSADTVVDFDHGLNRAINKIREALGESAETPLFIETLPRRGYRFIGTIVEPGTPREMPSSSANTREQEFRVAVLPFKHGSRPGLQPLAEGLTDGVVTGLSRFSYLRVLAHRSLEPAASEAVDLSSAGKAIGARYLLDGNIRQASSRLRISAQLVDASTGAHLWAETFDHPYHPEAVFELQDVIVPQIVCRVADVQGILPHTMSEALRGSDPDALTPHQAVLRSFAHFRRLNAQEHSAARAALERAVSKGNAPADCWAMLSMLYREEFAHNFNLRPDPLGRALKAALCAVESAPANHLAYHALASTLFFQREFSAFRTAAERALALNPMDGFAAAYLGFLIAYAGDWRRGCALAEYAMWLNPQHPGWYRFPSFFDAYREGDDTAALEIAQQVNMPDFWRTNLAFAVTYAQLGQLEKARHALDKLLAARPDFATKARGELEKWWHGELLDRLLDGLRKAGLETAFAYSTNA